MRRHPNTSNNTKLEGGGVNEATSVPPRTRLALWAAVFTLAAGCAKLTQFAVFAVLAATLSVSEFSAFGQFYALVTLLGAFAPAGVGERTMSLLKSSDLAEMRTILMRDSLGLTIAQVGVFFLLFLVVGVLYLDLESNREKCMLFLALALGSIAAFWYSQSFLFRLENRLRHSLVALNGYIITTAFGMMAGSLIVGNSIGVFSGGLVVSSAFSVVAVLASGIRFTIWSPKRLWRVLPELMPYKAIATFGWIAGYGINLLIVYMVAAEHIAAYTFLFSISSIAQLVASSINSVWLQRFVALHLAGNCTAAAIANRRFYSASAGVVAAISCVVLVAARFAPSGFGAVDIYLNKLSALAWLFAAYVITSVYTYAAQHFYVAARGAELMRLIAMAGIIGLGIWVACIMAFGPIGIYVGFFMNTLVKSAVIWIAARRKWQLGGVWSISLTLSATVIVIGYFVESLR